MANLKNTKITEAGFLTLPIGDSSARPFQNNSVRFNSDDNKLEYLDDDWKKALVGPETGAVTLENGFTVSGGSATGTGIFLSSSDQIGFSVQGNENATLDNQGRFRLPNRPAFSGFGTSTFRSGTYIFNSVENNVGNNYNTSDGRFTAPVDGIYLISYHALVGNQSSRTNIYIRVNNSDILRSRDDTRNSRWQTMSLCIAHELNANDFVTVRVDDGQVIGSSNEWTRLSVCLIY